MSTEAAIKYLNGYVIDNRALILKRSAGLGIPLMMTTGSGVGDESDYDRMKKMIQDKQKQEEEERQKKQEDFERQRMFAILHNNYKAQEKDPLSPTGSSPDRRYAPSAPPPPQKWDMPAYPPAPPPPQYHYPPSGGYPGYHGSSQGYPPYGGYPPAPSMYPHGPPHPYHPYSQGKIKFLL